MAETARRIAARIAAEITARPEQAEAAIAMIDEGSTVPFIARYRKEATGGLDDAQLRTLAERLIYLRELEGRRAAILESIRSQGKLTDALAGQIARAETKAELEDLYLPYKQKRRTRADIARERGLGPLAEAVLADRKRAPADLAAPYVTGEIADVKGALEGARDILAEGLATDAVLLGRLRAHMRSHALLKARVEDGKQETGAKFSDYFDHSETWAKAPSHRALAMLRGRNEGFLNLDLELDPAAAPVEPTIAEARQATSDAPGDVWLREVARWTWRVKLSTTLSLDLMSELRERAEAEAIQVFAQNLKDLLLAAPAGARPTLGLDPGIRTGVKVAALDATGKVVETTTVYPFQPRNDMQGAMAALAGIVARHKIELIAIGNGTASRETERLVADMLMRLPGTKPLKVIVSEAGASVYSASALASAELPGLDVSLRGAVSIARRLQDPLAELVKIEPKSIGVGQYQHDVDPTKLGRSLDGVVEDAVNAVGVDLNTASPALLARVSGLGTALAESIVAHRDATGPFGRRRDLLKVPRLGPRAFEQCAGFLRIRDGAEPLDASAVHPEAYSLANKIVAASERDLRTLMGDKAALRKLDPKAFVDDKFGLPTVRDILLELEKPGRDPRPEFRTATFADGIEDMKDLRPGMRLEGTVTNVAAFGAFVDIGVHQDGLVHVSQLADRFVKDPREVVKAGDVVKVRVVEVDAARKRIALTMRSGEVQASTPAGHAPAGRDARAAPKRAEPATSGGLGGLGAKLAEAMKGR